MLSSWFPDLFRSCSCSSRARWRNEEDLRIFTLDSSLEVPLFGEMKNKLSMKASQRDIFKNTLNLITLKGTDPNLTPYKRFWYLIVNNTSKWTFTNIKALIETLDYFNGRCELIVYSRWAARTIGADLIRGTLNIFLFNHKSIAWLFTVVGHHVGTQRLTNV